jgi:hypothetical protein
MVCTSRQATRYAPPAIYKEIPVIMYHASCFVCAARRVGRILKRLASSRDFFSPPIRDVIKLEWKKKRAFFESLVIPRNVIEHIDEEAAGPTGYTLFFFDKASIPVSHGKTADVSTAALAKVVSSLDVILDAIIKEAPAERMARLTQS